MIERFTDRARKVMALANQEAQRFNHEYIGTEHILLGLIKEGSGVGANVLKNLEVDLGKVRAEVEKLAGGRPDAMAIGKLPQTPGAKKVIEYAISEARSLNHKYVGTEHLLLGLLREREGVAAQVLMNLGLNLEDVREEVLNLLGAGIESETAADWLATAYQSLVAGHREAVEQGDVERASELHRLVEQLVNIIARKTRAQCPDPSCQHWNESGAKFCSQCGRRLADEKAD
jgi:ATP-dependent Clp protease ATP-binding subunit ClpC